VVLDLESVGGGFPHNTHIYFWGLFNPNPFWNWCVVQSVWLQVKKKRNCPWIPSSASANAAPPLERQWLGSEHIQWVPHSFSFLNEANTIWGGNSSGRPWIPKKCQSLHLLVSGNFNPRTFKQKPLWVGPPSR